ncbi:MAG TPA: MogA/MoaB family molybdenum cofactor biosynthesis protein [Solirubrobacterales bacterium]|jgi:molybdenum cofactor synthesis domain-containing protein|nr:MogA/MoaB family molybdenum cofactor biosynthesis protein [Solirubrobacterales bacterium]
MRAALLTVSTSKARGDGTDESGARLAEFATGLGLEIVAREIVADDQQLIAARLRHFCDDIDVALALTSGGTGLSPDDVTPEATREVIEREAPGIAEAMRAASRLHSPHWMLSRGIAGTRGNTLIVNFPGSPRSIGQCGEAIAPALPHALALLAGEHPSHR